MDYDFKNIKVGEIVEGIVIQVNDNEILLDLNYVLEGTIYINEFTQEKVDSFHDIIAEGDVVTALVKKIDDERGTVLLSRMGILKDETYLKIKELFKAGTPIEAVVDSQVNKGLILIYKGFEMFIHESQVALEQVELSEFVGKNITVLISDMDDSKQKIKVSRKQLLIKAERQQRKEEFESLTVGDVIKGEITDIKPFGAIVKFGNNQGLLPIGQVAHHRINKVEDELKLGEIVEVKVIEKTMKNNRSRISLSRKAILPTPFAKYAGEFGKGSTVKGKVINKLPFGIIVELADNVSGLLHNSEISWNPNDNFAASVVHGDEIEVHILNIDLKKERIALSKKYLENNPWGKVTAKRGDVLTGIISQLQVGKGFTVSVQGVDAFLPAEEITDEKIGKLDDIYTIGEEVEVKIIELYRDSWQMKVSVKEVQNERQRKEFDKYIKTQETRNVTIGDLFKDVLEKKKK